MAAHLIGMDIESGAGTEGADSSQIDFVYQVGGCADHNEAVQFVDNLAPDTTNSPLGRELVRGPFDWDPTDAEDCWIVKVSYVTFQPDDDGAFEYEFDTTGGEATITQAKDHVASYAPAGQTAPNYAGAIGVTDSGPEGCTVPAGAFKWTETHTLPRTVANFSYGRMLYAMHGRTNMQLFRGFAIGCVRFLGGTRRKKDKTNATVTLTFEAGPHVTNVSVGNGITIAEKKAWDYVWYRYEELEDTAAHAVVFRPTSAHVERVADPGDFSLFGVGTDEPLL